MLSRQKPPGARGEAGHEKMLVIRLSQAPLNQFRLISHFAGGGRNCEKYLAGW
jgi:hypothetical protein